MRDPETGIDVDPMQIGEGPLSDEQLIYKDNIIDHYRHPRNKKEIPHPSVVHAAVNPSCGDTLQVALVVRDGIIMDLGFQGKGCAISQASMSMLGERLIGMPVGEAMAISREHILEMLGIPIGIVRMKCALLGLRTTQAAIDQVKQ
jgi:nitrogen fixation protein NifU and related proteins